MQPISLAPHVLQIPFGFVNAYLIQTDEGWVLVDSGLKQTVSLLKSALSTLCIRPIAIVLTHGHLDHVGGAIVVAREWQVPVYVHRLEAPFLNGKENYPPYDPTIGGAMALVSRFAPRPQFKLSDRLELLPYEGHFPVLPGWEIIDTPGHTAGHISLFEHENRILLAGDALCTVDADSLLKLATMKPELARPGAPFTTNWKAAHQSVLKLADLEPVLIAAGHGQPMRGGDLPQVLRDFAHDFPMPHAGRYAFEAVLSDENGISELPPAPRDEFWPLVGLGMGLAVSFGCYVRYKYSRPS